MSATYYLFGKELLSSGIGVSAFPHMRSLVLNYIHVGTSAQLPRFPQRHIEYLYKLKFSIVNCQNMTT